MTTKAINPAVAFFLENAGSSYDPSKETKEQGQLRGAKLLAKAERQASQRGFTYNWSIDPHTDSSDFDDDPEPWALWQCAMYNAEGRIVNSLHGIDFGRDGKPWGDNYKRVVEAELATDGLTNQPQ
jgi:hypothetical protein